MHYIHKAVFNLIAVMALVGSLTLLGCGGSDDNTDPANAGNVNGQQFSFADGAAIDSRLAGRPTVLAFTNNGARATITAGTNQAVGANVFGSCIITIQTSNFPPTAGPQGGNVITLSTCEINTDTNSLSVVNASGASGNSNPGTPTGTTGG